MSEERVSVGQKVATSPLRRASTVNRILEATDYFHDNLAGGRPAVDVASAFNTATVKIRNLTGADRSRGELVQLGEYLLDVVDFRRPWFEGNDFAAPAFKLALLLAPVKSNEIGEAQIAGRCLGRVNVLDEAHTHAVPTAGEYVLKSSDFGPFELLSPPDGTGEQDIIVAFCDVRPVRLVLTADLDAGTAAAQLSAYSSGWSGTSRNYDAFDSTGTLTLAEGDVVWCLWSPESMRLEIVSSPSSVAISTIVHATAGGAMSSGSVTATVTRVLQGDAAEVDDTITLTDPGFGFESKEGTLFRATSDPEGTFWMDVAVCLPPEGE